MVFSPTFLKVEAGDHHLNRKLKALGHDARMMPAKYVRPYSKGQKNDFRDAECQSAPNVDPRSASTSVTLSGARRDLPR